MKRQLSRLLARVFLLCCLMQGYRLTAQTFAQTAGVMESQRSGHTATLLNTGMVLIAGGADNSNGDQGALSSAEIYNPASGIFSATGFMYAKRHFHSATLLTSGKVLIAGGVNYDTGVLAGAELYDTASGTFSPAGSLHIARFWHTATLLNDGTVLIVGSNSGNPPAELYNPTLNTFTEVGSLQTGRAFHTATLLNNGTVLITGGRDTNNNLLSSAELYNPATKTFTSAGSLNAARAYHTATLLANGNVLIAGGENNSNALSSTELYNASAGNFTTAGNLNTARFGHTATMLGNGLVLIAGGDTAVYPPTNVLGSAELFDPSKNTSTATGSMTTARGGQTATPLDDGSVLEAGGVDSSGNPLASAEIYSYPMTKGFINPKYVIMGVTYAPPGPSPGSFASYANSTYVGNTTSFGDSFSNASSLSISVGAGIKAWGTNGKVTGTSTTSYTQTSGTTSSVTVSQLSSIQDKTPGTPDQFNPVNHDGDIIWIWLNPLLIYSVSGNPNQPTSPNFLQWNGYGFDPTDPDGLYEMDVWPIYVGYLNGDFGPMDAQDAKMLARGWATGQTWPAGEGPALTPADIANVLAADPFGDPKNHPYNFTVSPGSNPATSTDGRFTISGGPTQQDQYFIYKQAAIGYPPVSQLLTNVYTNTTSLGQSSSHIFQQAFGMEEVFSNSWFGLSLQYDVHNTDTLTWTHQWQNTITNTTVETDNMQVTGPTCTGSPCNPQYAGPSHFDVYQDNLYGTFMFFPASTGGTGTASTGSITVGGADGRHSQCYVVNRILHCTVIENTGTVEVQVNGVTGSANYNGFSTPRACFINTFAV